MCVCVSVCVCVNKRQTEKELNHWLKCTRRFLLFSGALTMTVAFLYMLLWGLSHYTSHGRALGVHNYNTQVCTPLARPRRARALARRDIDVPYLTFLISSAMDDTTKDRVNDCYTLRASMAGAR